MQIGVQRERQCFCSGHLRTGKVLTQALCPILKLCFKNYVKALQKKASAEQQERGAIRNMQYVRKELVIPGKKRISRDFQ